MNTVISEKEHRGPAQQRFNGDGNSGAAEYNVWKCWAPAALVVKEVGGMRPETLGPWMYTLLDGQVALALDLIEINDICMDGSSSENSVKDSQTRW